ncbi:MAG: hypothetical protein HC839_03825 [Leptolyngbyaceae cyanobacterium RM2_2_21]|nr:hypothetical protein [Leptolyngbyaceae cyanobacterium RM2_2_21]
MVERQAVTQAKLNQTQQQLRSVSGQAQNLRSDISSLQSERQNLLAQQATVRAQIAERDREINQRDQEISQRDREIAQRNQAIAQRETRLQKLQDQQAYLEQQIEQLDREFLGLRQGSVAIGRNEPLVARAVEVNDPQQALAVVYPTFARSQRLVRIRRSTPALKCPTSRLSALPAMTSNSWPNASATARNILCAFVCSQLCSRRTLRN